jgi:N-acyl homoserine lactone hydrolase
VTADSRHSGTIDRLYVLNAGIAVAPDRSVYSPRKWQGEQITLSCNAYLIRRAGEWILWDTGIEDAIAKESGGRIIAHGIRGIVLRTIRCQLADIGITPADVSTVILSHAHFDHVGNAELFRHATWYIQRREHEAMFGADYEQHGYSPSLYHDLKQAKVALMDGDLDIFADGSVKVISTPGHTPSLLAAGPPGENRVDPAHGRCRPLPLQHGASLCADHEQRCRGIAKFDGARRCHRSR